MENLSFSNKVSVLKDFSNKVELIGGLDGEDGVYVNLALKVGANRNNVKSKLKKYFNVEFKKIYSYHHKKERFILQREDIEKVCKVFLRYEVDLDYSNRFDPLRERNTVAKAVYRYGEIRYDLL